MRSLPLKTLFLLLFSTLIATSAWAAKSIEGDEIDFATGRNDENILTSPAWDGAAGPSLYIGDFTCACQSGDPLVVRNKNRKPRYTVGASLHLGTLLADAMRQEARTLGLRVAESADEADLTVSGTIDELLLGERTIPYGPLMYYSHLDLSLSLTGSNPASDDHALSLYNIVWRYNAGFGAKDEAREAVAQFLVESSQEVLAFVARTLDVPAAESVTGALDSVVASGVKDRILEVRRVGLSGADGAAEKLAQRIDRESKEGHRIELYEALGNLREPTAVDTLTARFATDDEDGRYFIVKALAYIGGEDALAFVRDRATNDGDRGVRNLAERVTRP